MSPINRFPYIFTGDTKRFPAAAHIQHCLLTTLWNTRATIPRTTKLSLKAHASAVRLPTRFYLSFGLRCKLQTQSFRVCEGLDVFTSPVYEIAKLMRPELRCAGTGNSGLGGFADVRCLRYGFCPNDISKVFASLPHPELFWNVYSNICRS